MVWSDNEVGMVNYVAVEIPSFKQHPSSVNLGLKVSTSDKQFQKSKFDSPSEATQNFTL